MSIQAQWLRLKNRITVPIARSCTAFWNWQCLRMVTCVFPAGHFMGVNLKRYLFWTVSSLFLQAFLQVCREFQPALIWQILHCKFVASVYGSILHAIQFGHVFPLWGLVCQQLDDKCAPRSPTYSRTLTVANPCRSSHKSKVIIGYVFWLSGIGFSFEDRRLSSLVAGKF